MPGPLPNPQSRRRNAPTIPTTSLPAAGREGKPPAAPYKLGRAGRKWWAWAWSTPQATVWDPGSLYVVGRRAVLEDELAALAETEKIDFVALLELSDRKDMVERLDGLLSRLVSRASGSTTLMREMRELDNRLGLNPKAMADLRWSIEESDEQAPASTSSESPSRRLRAV
jgi:hypothetical protein